MSRTNLMNSLTHMHSIGNESIDEASMIDQTPSDDEQVNADVASEMPVETSPEDTADAVLAEQQEDDVASEEDSVATESIAMLIDNSIRQSFALEDLADQLNETLEGDGEGIDAVQAQMITTGSEVMDESGSQIAVENFNMDQRVATESLRDTVAEKASMLADSASAMITRAVRHVTTRVRYIVEQVQASNLRLMSYIKKADLLGEFAGQQISDPKILARLQKHLPLSGSGNQEIVRYIKQGLFGVIQNVTSLLTTFNRVRSSVYSDNGDKVMQAIVTMFKEVEKLNHGKFNGFDIKVTTPESYETEALLAMPIVRSVATIDLVPGTGDQTYKIVSKAELAMLTELLGTLRKEVSGLNAVIGNGLIEAPLKYTNYAREVVNKVGGGKEARDVYKLQIRSSVLINNVISRLVSDVSSIAGRLSRHAVLMVAASFESTGVTVDPADQSTDQQT